MNNNDEIAKIRKITGCPYWAIKKILTFTKNRLTTIRILACIYFVVGDHPEIVVKHNEEILKNVQSIQDLEVFKKESDLYADVANRLVENLEKEEIISIKEGVDKKKSCLTG